MSVRVQSLLDEGAAAKVFPCAWAVVRLDGEPVFEGGAGGATARTVFDLASLTKAVCTTPVFLSLWAEGTVEPDTLVARDLPESAAARAGVTVADLLYHRAGFPAFVPHFAAVMREHPRVFERDCPPEVRAAAREAAVARALATIPVQPPCAGVRYSDVGFVVLGELLADAARAPLDRLFAERVAAPLGSDLHFRRLSVTPAPGAGVGDIAPTGATRPREPAPGHEMLWAPPDPHPSEPGEVDDDNAWTMDGVAGHAGLFGTASDVAAFGQLVLDEVAGAGRIAPRRMWERVLERDPKTPGSTRALGFDTRLPGDATADAASGRYLGAKPPGAVGHQGFTGVSLWIDLARGLVVALCTNRTALGRAETRIREFRPRFHDAVLEALALV